MGNFLTTERVRTYTDADKQPMEPTILIDTNATVHIYGGTGSGAAIFSLIPFDVGQPAPFENGTRFTFVNRTSDPAGVLIVYTNFAMRGTFITLFDAGSMTPLQVPFLTLRRNEAVTLVLNKTFTNGLQDSWVATAYPQFVLPA